MWSFRSLTTSYGPASTEMPTQLEEFARTWLNRLLGAVTLIDFIMTIAVTLIDCRMTIGPKSPDVRATTSPPGSAVLIARFHVEHGSVIVQGFVPFPLLET
jgi:hypothetical protein